MSPVRHRHLASLMVLAACVSLAACGGKKRPPALAGPPPPPPASGSGFDDTMPTQTVDEGPDVVAMEGEYASGSDLESDYAATYEQGSPLPDVQFEYDSAALTEAARATLEKHALWLQSRRDVRVTVEGHCDKRGTTEYNLALGEQRARAVWDYLVSLGVAPERLRTVSYGKEQPLDPTDSEAAYAKNRRAHFSVSQ